MLCVSVTVVMYYSPAAMDNSSEESLNKDDGFSLQTEGNLM